MKGFERLPWAMVACALVACGGGGGGSGSDGAATRATSTTTDQGSSPTRPSAANAPPVIGGTPERTASPAADYQFRPVANDPDGDALRFSIANLPAWASFDERSGLLSGRPRDVDRGSFGPITLSVSDGVHQVSLEPFQIDVATPASDAAAVAERGITLSWQPPMQNADGSPIAADLRYRVHVGTESRNYTDAILLPEHEDLRYRIAPLAPGTYYLAMTTVTPDGIESEYSQEMTARLN